MRYIASYPNDAAIQAAVDSNLLGHPYVALDDQTGKIDWDSKELSDYSKMYFTIEVISAGTINLNLVSGKNMQYSVDNGQTWQNNDSISVQPGDEIMYKGTNNTLTGSTFSASTAYFNVYGNSMSLLYGDDFVGKTSIQNAWGTFKFLFSGSNVVNASNLILPATTVYAYAYQNMFSGCTSLTTAPALPATTLATACYQFMFQGCASLTNAPELPALTTATYCYVSMFNGCTSINYVKCLARGASTTIKSACTSWLSGVSATGTFVKNASMNSWTTGVNGIPSGWTVVDAQ